MEAPRPREARRQRRDGERRAGEHSRHSELLNLRSSFGLAAKANSNKMKHGERRTENEDSARMTSWSRLFGPGSLGLFVFLYRIGPTVNLAEDTLDVWNWRGARYLLRAVSVDAYRRHMKVRSPKWGTVCLPGATFQTLA